MALSPPARAIPTAMEQWPPIMTEHPPIEDDSIGERAEGTGHSFAATLADSRMPSDQATRNQFGRIRNALICNTGMEVCTLTSSNMHLSKIKLVAVYGDDEATIVYMTAHTPQSVQRAGQDPPRHEREQRSRQDGLLHRPRRRLPLLAVPAAEVELRHVLPALQIFKQ